MKRILTIFCLLLVATASAKNQPAWLKDAVIYHIYPSTYMDSDGNGIGDLKGITSRLDYIRSCGFNCIWMSPCFASAWEDGGYDIIDYYKVDPRFGTNDDLKALIDKAHGLGIKVLLDLVAGHTSDKHPWFKESSKAERNQYSDYYIWTVGKNYKKPGPKFVNNNYPRDGYYIRNFFECQPALNYGYYSPKPNHHWEQGYDAPGPTAVRAELKKIIAHWCDMGADGFRVDMAQSLVKSDTKNRDGVRRLWNEIFEWYNSAYPENIMLSEWSNPEQSLSAGFNIDLLIHNGIGGKVYRPLVCETTDKMVPTVCYFNREGKGEIRAAMELYGEIYNTYRRLGGYASMPTNSHDIWRLTRMNRTTAEEQKVAITLFLTLPTPPIVYYGEEIGMRNLEYAPAKEGSVSSRNRSVCQFKDDLQKRQLTVKVMSFAYKKGIPNDPTGNGGGFVFDCRAVNNPGKYERYKPFTGLDEPIIKFLEDDGEIFPFLENAYALVDASVKRYMERGFSNLMVCFGCTGGQHRSVYSAQHMAEHLNKKFGVKVELIHREQNIEQTFEAKN